MKNSVNANPCLVCLGWDIPCSTGTAVLPWRFLDMGSHDHHPSWPVSFWQFLIASSSNLPHDGLLLRFCRYYVSLAYIASFFPVAWMFRVAKTFDVLCSTAALRSTNVILAMVCAVLFHDLLLCIQPGIGERKATTYAILVALYPVHWFFTFLYYTDVASLAAVLAMYLFCLKKQFWIGATVSAWTNAL